MNDNGLNTPEETAMEAAIAAHFAAETEGAVLTGYYLVAKGKTMDDFSRTRFLTTYPDHIEYDQALGLARFGMLDIESQFREDEDD